MSQRNIQLGTSPSGLDGDDARTAFGKVNDNFTELYSTKLTVNGGVVGNKNMIYAPSIDVGLYDGALEIREAGLVGPAYGGNPIYAPAISFHYAGSVVGKLFMDRVGALNWTYGLKLNGYARLGDSAPAIKMKKLAGTSAWSQGATALIAHGLDSSKIIGIQVLVGPTIPAGFITVPGYQYDYHLDPTHVRINNHINNSGSLLGLPVVVLITYEE